jgi:hypothetical protein
MPTDTIQSTDASSQAPATQKNANAGKIATSQGAEANASAPDVMDGLAESVAKVDAMTAGNVPVVELQEYVELQQQIADADARADRAANEGIRARWEFGMLLLQERHARGGKQLPNGRMAEIVRATALSRADISRRMQFAERFPTESQVSQACETYKSWTQIVSKALPTRSAAGDLDTDPFAEKSASAVAKEVGDALTRMDNEAAKIRRVRHDREGPTLAAIFTELRRAQVDDDAADKLVRVRRELYALGRASRGETDDRADVLHVINVVVTEARALSGDLTPEVRASAVRSLREVADFIEASVSTRPMPPRTLGIAPSRSGQRLLTSFQRKGTR